MSKDKFNGNDNLLKTFPNFKKLLEQVKEDYKEYGEEQRKHFLTLLAEHYPHNLEHLPKKDVEFLVNQTSHLCKEITGELPDETTPFTSYNYDFLYSFLNLKKHTYESFISSFPKKEKELVFSHLSSLYVQFLDAYEEGRESWIFENKNYRVFELLQDVDEFSLFRMVQERKPEHWDDYTKFYHKIMKLTPKDNQQPYYVYIQENEEDEIEMEYEVFGYSKEHIFSEIALNIPVEEWVSHYIASDNLKTMAKEEILYCVLWEIFLSSFDEQ